MEIIAPSKTVINKILKKQNNRCARKPYFVIDGLENYSCLLWKRKTNKGKFVDEEYIIYNNGITDEKIALCKKCSKVLENRKLYHNEESSQEDDMIIRPSLFEKIFTSKEMDIIEQIVTIFDENDIKHHNIKLLLPYLNSISFDNEVIGVCDVIYSFIVDFLNIYELPCSSSTKYGELYVGQNCKIIAVINNKWCLINYDREARFIKFVQNGQLTVKNIPVEENITAKECIVCYEKIINKYVLVPCGHTALCGNCIVKLKERYPKSQYLCPLCNSKVDNCVKIYD